MTERERMKEIFEKLKEEHPIDEMIQFDERNIQEAQRENPWKIAYYGELHEMERLEYERLKDLFEKLIGMRYDHYKRNSNLALQKQEIEKYYLPQDKRILKMKRILRRQEVRVKFFEIAVEAFKARNWRLSSYIDGIKRGL